MAESSPVRMQVQITTNALVYGKVTLMGSPGGGVLGGPGAPLGIADYLARL